MGPRGLAGASAVPFSLPRLDAFSVPRRKLEEFVEDLIASRARMQVRRLKQLAGELEEEDKTFNPIQSS